VGLEINIERGLERVLLDPKVSIIPGNIFGPSPEYRCCVIIAQFFFQKQFLCDINDCIYILTDTYGGKTRGLMSAIRKFLS